MPSSRFALSFLSIATIDDINEDWGHVQRRYEHIGKRDMCERKGLTFLVLIRQDKPTYRPFTLIVRKEGFTRRRTW